MQQAYVTSQDISSEDNSMSHINAVYCNPKVKE